MHPYSTDFVVDYITWCRRCLSRRFWNNRYLPARRQPKSLGTKYFDFKRTAIFVVRHRPSKHQTTRYAWNFGGMPAWLRLCYLPALFLDTWKAWPLVSDPKYILRPLRQDTSQLAIFVRGAAQGLEVIEFSPSLQWRERQLAKTTTMLSYQLLVQVRNHKGQLSPHFFVPIKFYRTLKSVLNMSPSAPVDFPSNPAWTTFLASLCNSITRQPIELESCSNLLVRFKKFLKFWISFFCGWRQKWGRFRHFWPRSSGPGSQEHEPKFWITFLVKTML